MKQTYRRTAAMSSSAEKPLSATTTTRRSGSQRLVCKIAFFAQLVSALCRFPCTSLQRADGANIVRNGNAQRRPANGTGNIRDEANSYRSRCGRTRWVKRPRAA